MTNNIIPDDDEQLNPKLEQIKGTWAEQIAFEMASVRVERRSLSSEPTPSEQMMSEHFAKKIVAATVRAVEEYLQRTQGPAPEPSSAAKKRPHPPKAEVTTQASGPINAELMQQLLTDMKAAGSFSFAVPIQS